MKDVYVDERTVEKGTAEFKRLEAVAKMLEAFSKKGNEYKVEDVYFDLSQDWMWTTITTETEWARVQVLNPRQWMAIMTAETTDELMDVYHDIINGNYFIER